LLWRQVLRAVALQLGHSSWRHASILRLAAGSDHAQRTSFARNSHAFRPGIAGLESRPRVWSVVDGKTSLGEALVGSPAIRRGDLDYAEAIAGEHLAGWRELADEQGFGSALINVAEVTLLQGDHTRAASLHAESRQLVQTLGDDRTISATYARLDESALASAWESGQAWSLEQAVTETKCIAETPAHPLS
jgi:hypothetical protein